MLQSINRHLTLPEAFVSGNVKEKLAYASGVLAVIMAFTLPISTTAMHVSFMLAIICNITSGDAADKFNFILKNPIAKLFIVFYIALLLGTLYTVAPMGDAIHMLKKYDKFFFAIFLLPIFREKMWRERAINAFIIAMVITLALSYLNALGILDFNLKKGTVAVFKTRIATSLMMSLMTYLLAYRIFTQVQNRWAYGIVILLASYNILFMSDGRTGYVIFFGLTLLLIFQCLRGRALIFGLAILVAMGMLAGLGSDTFRYRVQLTNNSFHRYQQGDGFSSMGYRLEYTRGAWDIIKHHPLLGAGTGSFKSEYQKRVTKPMYVTTNPHNEYLNIAVQLGGVGLMLLLMLFSQPWHLSHRLPRPYGHLAQAVLVSFAIGCTLNSWFMDSTEGHLYVYFMALMFS